MTNTLPKAFFAKADADRAMFIDLIQEQADGQVVHLHPKNSPPAPGNDGVMHVTFEEMKGRDTWLAINALAATGTLVIDKPSRYGRVGSARHRDIALLAKRFAPRVFLTDIVPFTGEMKFIYTPYSYIGTEILGYPKYFAIHEEYNELVDGVVVEVGKNQALIASKVAPASQIAYSRFTADRVILSAPCTNAELVAYAELKERLFAKYTNPDKIVTRLADKVHAFQSRIDALLAAMESIQEKAIIYTNLDSYAKSLNSALKKAGLSRHRAISYQKGCIETAECVVYMESPIVNTHNFLDAEARVDQGGMVIHVLGDSKVDLYLHGRITGELNQIDAFTQELFAHCNGESVTCQVA